MPEIDDLIPRADDMPVQPRSTPGGGLREDVVVAILVVAIAALFFVIALLERRFDPDDESLDDRPAPAVMAALDGGLSEGPWSIVLR